MANYIMDDPGLAFLAYSEQIKELEIEREELRFKMERLQAWGKEWRWVGGQYTLWEEFEAILPLKGGDDETATDG